jgi:hypothetical protein
MGPRSEDRKLGRNGGGTKRLLQNLKTSATEMVKVPVPGVGRGQVMVRLTSITPALQFSLIGHTRHYA